MQIINPYLLILWLWFTKILRLRDPNESLRKPKHWVFKLPQASLVIPPDDVGIHRRRQLFAIHVHKQQCSSRESLILWSFWTCDTFFRTRSSSLNLCRHTLLSKVFFTLLWYSRPWLMVANLLPSIRFNWSKRAWAHFNSSNPDSARILKEGTSTSNESITSILYTKEKGVALVDERTKVR